MNKTIAAFIALCFICGQNTGKDIIPGPGHNIPDVIFEIIQDGRLIRPTDKTFHLNKAIFTLRLTMINIDGAYVNTSFAKFYFDMPDSTGIELLDAKVLPEYGENKEREIYIDTIGFHYWCNCQKDMPPYFFNKFNYVKINGDTIIGERIIENYFNKTDFKIADINREIYIMILLMQHEKEKPVKELRRKKFIIRWN